MKDVILKMKDLNPLCTTVTGRSRTPEDLGDIECHHGPIKKILSKCIEDIKSKAVTKKEKQKISWVSELPTAMAVMNKSKRRVYNTTLYEVVFGGRLFDDPLYAALQGKSPAEILTVQQMLTHISVESSMNEKWKVRDYIGGTVDDSEVVKGKFFI